MGWTEPDTELYEGIPDHLAYPLTAWTDEAIRFAPEAVLDAVASRLRMPLEVDGYAITYQIRDFIRSDARLHLNFVDHMLALEMGSAGDLEAILEFAGSAYTVEDDRLQKRVSDEERDSYRKATSAEDEVSKELKEAWHNAFGQSPDPSDAWDHAITAVEDLLIPIIVPGAKKANLGHVISAINDKPSKWTYGMDDGGQKDEMGTLAALVAQIWANPDRHGGGLKRTPRQDEAERVVMAAVLIVNLCRGHLVAR